MASQATPWLEAGAPSTVGRLGRMRPSLRLILILAFVGMWELIARQGVVPSIILPAPSAVLIVGFTDFGPYLNGLQVTAFEILAGSAIAVVFGVGLGVLVGSSPLAMRVFTPLLDSTFALPWVVFYPLSVVWFGIGSPSKILFSGVHAIFPILLATAAAVSIVDQRYVLLARALGASRRQLYLKILLPFALPQIVGGLRVGLGLVVIGIIVGEMLSSFGGIGYLISHAREVLDAPRVYFGILLGLGLAIGTNAGMTWLEKRVAGWQA
ncbi:MAG: ABC transporter permease [Chloroflexota bacterium]